MRVRKVSLIILAGLALLGLSACPKSTQQPAGGSTVSNGGKPAVSGQPASGSEESPQVVEGVSESGEAATAVTPPKSEIDTIPEGDEITGKWFALYGSQFSGPSKFDFASGHQIEFLADGNAIWTIRSGGADIANITARYRVEGPSLILNFNRESLEQDKSFGSSTPLGFGRDKEVGLTSAGRDKEIGLSGETGAGKDSEGEVRLAMKSDGRFLSLSDEFKHILVYGRVKNPGTSYAAKLSGDWEGYADDPHQRFAATFKLEGSKVMASMDGGKRSFEGVLTQGYLVGGMKGGPEGNALAAFLMEDEKSLNGVYTPEPYTDLKFHLDFARLIRK